MLKLLSYVLWGTTDINSVLIDPLKEGMEPIVDKGVALGQDTIRNTSNLIDNTVQGSLYTVRDTKSEILHALDSAGDNIAVVVNNGIYNTIQTIQMISLISGGTMVIALVMYGDKIIDKGISIGNWNLI